MKLDGKKLASELLAQLKTRAEELIKQGIVPTLAVILIGDDHNSLLYIRQKELKAEEIGAKTEVYTFPPSVKALEIASLVKKLDADPKIHGIILQRPAPDSAEVDKAEEFISPKKEVDGFGSNSLYPVPVAEAVYRLVKKALGDESLKNKKTTVLGKGETAGMPIINYFRKRDIEPTVIDSKTQNKEKILSNSGIVISAVGKENVVDPSILKKGTILIGVGLRHDADGKLKGDFENEEAEKAELYFSPTPGGVGPLNVACLMENLVKAASYE